MVVGKFTLTKALLVPDIAAAAADQRTSIFEEGDFPVSRAQVQSRKRC